jgi:ubiquinone biosynthesis protein Coq4
MKKLLDIEKKLIKNFSPYNTNTERISMMVKSAYNGLIDPHNGSYISELGDLSSMNTLKWIKTKMESDETGSNILREKPVITEETIQFEKLANFPKNTLGYNYYLYMNENKFTPNERPLVRYVPDIELAYICQRYKETHDFYHVLLGYEPSLLHEVSVKWFEALHLRLPSPSFASIFGCMTLSVSEMFMLYNRLLPHVIRNAKESDFVLNVYYEKLLEEDIGVVKRNMNIISLDEFKC